MVSEVRSCVCRLLRRRQGRLGDTWQLDGLFVNIQGASSISGAPSTKTAT